MPEIINRLNFFQIHRKEIKKTPLYNALKFIGTIFLWLKYEENNLLKLNSIASLFTGISSFYRQQY